MVSMLRGTNLCEAGASSVLYTYKRYWKWICFGSDGVGDASCNAYIDFIYGEMI
jgi:hypothetical protein